MIIVKTSAEIEKLAQGGQILAQILKEVKGQVAPGVSLALLNELAEELMAQKGGEPSFKSYKSSQSEIPFPATLCASVNEELVHAPANRDITLKEGDILSLDLGLKYEGLFTDMAVTVPVGHVSAEAKKLIKVTQRALELGIKKIKPGNFLHDIARAIQGHVEKEGFSVVRQLVGHGVGKAVHEDPRIPNFVADKQPQIKLEEGMVLAIEPMVNAGDFAVKTRDDGWTVVTVDGRLCAHFEHTVAVTKKGHKVLTALSGKV